MLHILVTFIDEKLHREPFNSTCLSQFHLNDHTIQWKCKTSGWLFIVINLESLSAITMKLQSVMSSPGSTAWSTNCVMELVALAKATALPASRGQPTHLSVFVNWFGDPLGIWIAPDSFVEWINQNDLKEFVCGILTHPVRIQHSQSSTVSASTLLENKIF